MFRKLQFATSLKHIHGCNKNNYNKNNYYYNNNLNFSRQNKSEFLSILIFISTTASCWSCTDNCIACSSQYHTSHFSSTFISTLVVLIYIHCITQSRTTWEDHTCTRLHIKLTCMHYVEKLNDRADNSPSTVHKIYSQEWLSLANKVKKLLASSLQHVASFLSNMLFVLFVSAYVYAETPEVSFADDTCTRPTGGIFQLRLSTRSLSNIFFWFGKRRKCVQTMHTFDQSVRL